jgi:5-methylcytosine-specific restriction endonuclease McrA
MGVPLYKKVVRERDGYKCVDCGTKGSKNNPLTVHHKKPKCFFPRLAHDPNNCELLCTQCHRKRHKEEVCGPM